MDSMTCFKAYDIRGRVPDQLNVDIAYRIGRATAAYLMDSPEALEGVEPKIVVGHDIRLSSPELSKAVSEGIRDAGLGVVLIGQCGTEEVYFATSHLNACGGVCVTASHNPKDYNGMKLVRKHSMPISGDTGLFDIQALAERAEWGASAKGRGKLESVDTRPALVEHLLGYINSSTMKPLKIVTNAGHGGAGPLIDALKPHLPFEWVHLQHDPDGHFPKGVPNPLLPENRHATAKAVVEQGADFGVAWDGDFDRCFFFDHQGRFIEGYYIVGLLADSFLDKSSEGVIIHDPRLIWNTQDIVTAKGGVAVESKTGHAFIKERMRTENAVYGGEMSAHHYFRDFFYCDSGMIPWLLIAEKISQTGQSLASMLDERMMKFPVSGEMNYKVNNPKLILERLLTEYEPLAISVSKTDGIGLDMGEWRFNVRMSNTEPLLRLNVETRHDPELLKAKTEELIRKLQ